MTQKWGPEFGTQVGKLERAASCDSTTGEAELEEAVSAVDPDSANDQKYKSDDYKGDTITNIWPPHAYTHTHLCVHAFIKANTETIEYFCG